MSNAIKILPYYTYTDYIQWEGRWEIIYGMPFAMSPAPAPKHQRVVSRLHQAFLNALDAEQCNECKVYDFIDVKVTDDTIVQPDLLIVCDEIIKPYLDFPASLVLEVLSPATTLKDRNNKYHIYQSFKIPYYIIVDVEIRSFEVYNLEDDVYNLQESKPLTQWPFHFGSECEVYVDFSKLWD